MDRPRSCILVVDDDENVLVWANQVLVAEGFRVLAARNAGECIEMIDAHHPDLVLLDLLLPDVNGMMVLRFLQRLHSVRSVPVIVQSAIPEDEGRRMTEALGARDYLQKPSLPSALVARVRAVLSGSREGILC